VLPKHIIFLYKIKRRKHTDAKKSGGKFYDCRDCPVTGEHYLIIPEWICDENGWYEGTTVNMVLDRDSIIITEVAD